MAPGRAYQSTEPVTTEQMVAPAADLAGALGSGGSLGAVPGAVGIFGGRLAKTANLQALKTAEEMAAKGAPVEDIFKNTGWFQGADKKWRFEIDDSKSSVSPGQGGYWSEHVDHPDFFKAYPDTKKLEANISYGDERGSFYDTGMSVTAPTRYDMRSVALHEMQHGIQAREGFAPGGNPADFTRDLKRVLRDYNDQITEINSRLKAASGTPRYNELMELRQELVNEIHKIEGPHGIGAMEKGHAQYKNLPGEVEARNVQYRMDLTPEQRRALPPWLSEQTILGMEK